MFYPEIAPRDEAQVISCKRKWLKRCTNPIAYQVDFYRVTFRQGFQGVAAGGGMMALGFSDYVDVEVAT